MAEAIVNARCGEQWQAVSAGMQPTGYVHPLAVRALAEIGIQHEGRSKHVNEFRETPLFFGLLPGDILLACSLSQTAPTAESPARRPWSRDRQRRDPGAGGRICCALPRRIDR